MVADELIAHLRYFPLLAGRIEIADVTLVRPTISVSFLPGGESNWSGLIQSLAHALEPDPGRTASFSEIGIHEGTVIVHNEYGGEGPHRPARGGGVSARLAVDLPQLRRQRPLRLA